MHTCARGLQPAVLSTITSHMCRSKLSVCFSILLACPTGHDGFQRLEEAVVTDCANTGATLPLPHRTATAEPTSGHDKAHLLLFSAERSPGASHTALVTMHMWEQWMQGVIISLNVLTIGRYLFWILSSQLKLCREKPFEDLPRASLSFWRR